jgi:endo-1,4-beta-xylanase
MTSERVRSRPIGPVASGLALARAAASTDRSFGAAVQAGNLADAQYVDVLDAQFSSITPENDLKWESTEPQPGVFQFEAADAVVDHALASGMIVRGHTLVWHSQLPAYVNAITDPAELTAATDRHITEVAGHYQGKFEYWDVVNEAFDDDGTRCDNSPFQQVLGDGYIEAAFTKAREVEPTTKLCYNDFDIEGINAKSDAVLELVSDFKARGVPIDCVGFQSHFIAGQVPADLQANDYQTVIAACLAVTDCTNITAWQVSDRESWVPSTFAGQGAALLLDENRVAKPAFAAALEALGGRATE